MGVLSVVNSGPSHEAKPLHTAAFLSCIVTVATRLLVGTLPLHENGSSYSGPRIGSAIASHLQNLF